MRPERRAELTALEGRCFDVAVIGAGAVGCSVAQHLCARGYEVLLIDRGDVAGGTSGRSSRLLYCGLAYLSPDYPLWKFLLHPRDLLQRLRLARQAMRCRAELVQTMPERLRRLQFIFPITRNSGYPAWKVALGFRVLSLLGSRCVPLGYRRLSADDARARYVGAARLEAGGLAGVATFDEYQYAWAERIVMDTALDARRMGCILRSYTAVTDLHRAGEGWDITLAERAPEACGMARVRARHVINAAGPWADQLTRRAGNRARPRLTGMKGVNLIVKLPGDWKGLGLETISSLGQPFYMMPWGDHHFLGPTETVFEGDPDDVRVDVQDVAHILGEANRILPGLALGEDDIVYRWAGVRPHTAAQGANAGELAIHDMAGDGLPGMLTVTGCPIMTHRHAGRSVAAMIAHRLPPSGSPRTLSYAATLMPEAIRTDSGLSAAEIRHAAAHEEVVTLADLVLRRLSAGWRPDMGLADLDRICAEAAPVLGWDERRQAAEKATYRAHVAENFQPRTP